MEESGTGYVYNIGMHNTAGAEWMEWMEAGNCDLILFYAAGRTKDYGAITRRGGREIVISSQTGRRQTFATSNQTELLSAEQEERFVLR